VLGLLIGSFLNVVIYRTPKMMERDWRAQCAELAAEDAAQAAAAFTGKPNAASNAARVDESAPLAPEKYNLVVPRSACPHCKRQIQALENIPVVSWLVLRGKCAGCGARISGRYPFVEILTGVMFGAVAWKLGFGWPALGALVLTAFLIALAFIDIDTQLLPDVLTYPLLWLGIFAALMIGPASPAETAHAFPVDLRSSVIGAIAGYMSLWLVYHLFRLLTGKEGMGYGDFKLLAAIGAWLGWKMLLPTILFSAAVGAIAGIAILSMQKKERSTPISFGPFLAAAGWLMLMWGHEVVDTYLGLFAQRP
jgi:leader peptidase (prepilin peptidase)/N-methyltransferase